MQNEGPQENKKCDAIGILDGKRPQGRPNREWTDDIREWCKQDLYSLTIGLHKEDCGNK